MTAVGAKQVQWFLLATVLPVALGACDAVGDRPAMSDGQREPAASEQRGASGAGAGEQTAGEGDGCAELSCLNDASNWLYRPTRELQLPAPPLAGPDEMIAESAYAAVDVAATHVVLFSSGGEQVELRSTFRKETLTGARTVQSAERIEYELDAFAGGRFAVWTADGKLAAELTLFGSGVPITASTRGILDPQPNPQH